MSTVSPVPCTRAAPRGSPSWKGLIRRLLQVSRLNECSTQLVPPLPELQSAVGPCTITAPITATLTAFIRGLLPGRGAFSVSSAASPRCQESGCSNCIPVVSLFTPCCRQPLCPMLLTKTVLAFVRQNTSVSAPLEWWKNAWEAAARNPIHPGKAQNTTYTFRQWPQPHCLAGAMLLDHPHGTELWDPPGSRSQSPPSPLALTTLPVPAHHRLYSLFLINPCLNCRARQGPAELRASRSVSCTAARQNPQLHPWISRHGAPLPLGFHS